jgi:transposase
MATNRVSLQELERVLPTRQLSKLAVKYRVDACNQHRLPGVAVFTCLLDSIMNHGVTTQRLLEEIHFQRTGTHADHSSFGKRLFNIFPTFFEAVYQDVHARLAPQSSAAEQRALRVRWADATIVTLSSKLLFWGLSSGNSKGKGTRRQVKTVLSLEEDGLPRLLRICENPSEHSDAVALGDSMLQHAQPGDLWVFDKGCDSRQRLLDLHEKKTFWLTPHGTHALRDRETIWKASSAAPVAPPETSAPTFFLERVEKACFGNKNEKLKWKGLPLLVLSGLRWDTRNNVWTPMVLLTNLPPRQDGEGAGPYTWAEVTEVYRKRWEIEVLFKFLKQHLGYAHLTSRSENGIRVMVYMALIAALLLIWYKRHTGIDRGWRSVRSWFAHDLRRWVEDALRIAFGVPEPSLQG